MTRRSSSVTIRDVAKQAGVSVATVSRYINKNAPISLETAERLNAVMTRLKYVPHAAARHLASKKTRVVGLLLNNLHNDFFVPLLNGIEDVIRQKEYNLIIATYHTGNCQSSQPPVGPHNTDGMLVFADALSDDDLAALNKNSFPMVTIYRASPPMLAIPSVTVENMEVTQMAVDHLIKVHNRKRILFVRGPILQEDSIRRELGYRNALQANGLIFDEELVLNGDFERDIAYKAMREFLGSGGLNKFDAVFTGDDYAAIGVLRALQEYEIKVPEQVSVVGFDDLSFAPFLNPPLTTVRAPTEEVGRKAVEKLFAILENQPASESIVLPTEIIYRRSCGCGY